MSSVTYTSPSPSVLYDTAMNSETGMQRTYSWRPSQMRIDKYLGIRLTAASAKTQDGSKAQVLTKLQYINSVPAQQKTACQEQRDHFWVISILFKEPVQQNRAFLQSTFLLWRVSLASLTEYSWNTLTALSPVRSSPSQTKNMQVSVPSVLQIRQQEYVLCSQNQPTQRQKKTNPNNITTPSSRTFTFIRSVAPNKETNDCQSAKSSKKILFVLTYKIQQDDNSCMSS